MIRHIRAVGCCVGKKEEGQKYIYLMRRKYLARRGTITTVAPKRIGSVNFVITQAIINTPAAGHFRIKSGTLLLPV